MNQTLMRRIAGALCCLAFLLAGCGAEWVPVEQAAPESSATVTAGATASPTPSLAAQGTPAPVTAAPDETGATRTPPGTAAASPRAPRATRTPTPSATPPSAEEQLATFYAEATGTATAAGTPLRGGRAPTRTRTNTPTPTITPTPLPPFAVLRIDRPGRMSKVISPFRAELGVTPGEDGSVHIDLIGEDGRYISRQVLSYGSYKGKSIGIAPDIEFQISAVAETARLVISINDKTGRVRNLTSVDLILLSIGDNEINPTEGQREAYIVRRPKDGDVITGGVLHLEGLARPVNSSPLILELVAEDGSVVGQTSLTVPAPSGDLSHTPYSVDIAYTVQDITPVRLVIRQESTTRIPGTVELSSRELILAP